MKTEGFQTFLQGPPAELEGMRGMNDVSMRPEFVIANVLPGKLNALVKNLMRLTGIEDPIEVVDSINRSEWKLTEITNLEFVGKVTFKVTKPIDLSTFFESKRGLQVSGNFKRLFVLTDTIFTIKDFSLSKYQTIKNVMDHKIHKELPDRHIFESEDFCPMLATMIHLQWGGVSGELIKDGHSSIFYVHSKDRKEILPVFVHYHKYKKEWVIDIPDLYALGLEPESIIFAPD